MIRDVSAYLYEEFGKLYVTKTKDAIINLLAKNSAEWLVEEGLQTFQRVQALFARTKKETTETTNIETVNSNFKKLEEKLVFLTELLDGASAKLNTTTTNSIVITWLRHVQTVVYEVQDLYDARSYETLASKPNIMPTPTILPHPTNLSTWNGQVITLLDSIDALYQEARQNGIEPVKVAAGQYEHLPELDRERRQKLAVKRSAVDYNFFLGREKDSEMVAAMLQKAANSEATLNVVAIVGVGGIGKTSLSKNVCKSDSVKNLFNQVIQVLVSGDYNESSIMKKIKGELENEKSSSSSSSPNEKKKYLLVLDDVWNTFEWKTFEKNLLDMVGSKGTVTIFVTSRERLVVENMKTEDNPNSFFDCYQLPGLSEDESWSLFMHKFSGDTILPNSDYEKLAKAMVDRCEGIPLAINLLARLLTTNRGLQKWKQIKESKAWTKVNDEKDDITLPSLKLSYEYLKSPSLKTCFSYCAILGEDEEINKHRLIQLWMAQGFLQPRPGFEMEDIGEEYFNDLLNSSLFYEPFFDHLGKVESVKMHDVVRELACQLSKGEIWCYNETEKSNGSDTLVRHLLVPESECDQVQLHGCRNLRTCVYKGKVSNLGFLNDCKKVRALSIQLDSADTQLKEEDWKQIGDLKYLRFLEIIVDEDAPTEYIEYMDSHLLPQIAKLYHLQTLYLSTSNSKFGCMLVIPKEFGNLVNLRHLCSNERNIGIFEGLGYLSALQTLPTIVLRHHRREDNRMSELQKLKNLRGTLTILHVGCIKSVQEAESLGLGDKSSLTTLVLSYHGSDPDDHGSDPDDDGSDPDDHGSDPDDDGDYVDLGDDDDGDSSNKNQTDVQQTCKDPESQFIIHKDDDDDDDYAGDTSMAVVSNEDKDDGDLMDEDDDTRIKNDNDILEALKPHNSLMALKIYGFTGTKLPKWLTTEKDTMSNLDSLHLNDLDRIEGVLNLGNFISLRVLKLERCNKLTITLRDNETTEYNKLLEKIEIVYCDGVTSIPDLSPLIKLRSLTVLGRNIARLVFCSTLRLTKLYTHGYLLPESLTQDDPLCKSLNTLKLDAAFKVELLPKIIQHFVALQNLKIMGFGKLKALPEFLGKMNSLRNLELYNLPSLKRLPSKAAMDNLTNLNRLHILNCEKLTQELQRKGDEWSKISRIPNLHLLDDIDSMVESIMQEL